MACLKVALCSRSGFPNSSSPNAPIFIASTDPSISPGSCKCLGRVTGASMNTAILHPCHQVSILPDLPPQNNLPTYWQVVPTSMPRCSHPRDPTCTSPFLIHTEPRRGSAAFADLARAFHACHRSALPTELLDCWVKWGGAEKKAQIVRKMLKSNSNPKAKVTKAFGGQEGSTIVACWDSLWLVLAAFG